MRRLLLLLMLAALSLSARAQAVMLSEAAWISVSGLRERPPQNSISLSEAAQISLITILPGDQAYSLWGHSAVRVYDPVTGYDASYNYGTFDFRDPLSFVARFAYGKLDYFLSVQPYQQMVPIYWQVEGRPVIEQVLDLTPAQRQAVFQFLEINALPENRYYRYDFLFDNCSTRIRDLLKEVLGADLQFALEADPELTFRDYIDQYAVEQPFLDTAMDLGMGVPADREATAWEAMFLPLNLMEAFDRATLMVDGEARPFVARRDSVRWSAEQASLDPAPPWPVILTLGLLALGLFLTIRDLRAGRRQRRWFDGLLYGVVGVAGLLIVFLWFISLHTVTPWNLNLLWAWPTHVLAAGALVGRVQRRWLAVYLLAAAAAALVVVLGWPFWAQSLPLALLPFLLLLALRGTALAWLRLRDETSEAPPVRVAGSGA